METIKNWKRELYKHILLMHRIKGVLETRLWMLEPNQEGSEC